LYKAAKATRLRMRQKGKTEKEKSEAKFESTRESIQERAKRLEQVARLRLMTCWHLRLET
jgi:hypothetical protein